MNTRMLIPGTLLALTALAALKPSSAARTGEAEVREGPRGGPCFTIGQREERLGTPDFRALTVSDGARLMWKMSLPAGRSFPLSFSMCVPYGGRVASLPRTQAAALEPGKVYYVHVETRPAKGKNMPTAYEGRFCLARQPDGSVTVHQILQADREGRRLYGCQPPSETAAAAQ
jgi:hypothetical protein